MLGELGELDLGKYWSIGEHLKSWVMSDNQQCINIFDFPNLFVELGSKSSCSYGRLTFKCLALFIEFIDVLLEKN